MQTILDAQFDREICVRLEVCQSLNLRVTASERAESVLGIQVWLEAATNALEVAVHQDYAYIREHAANHGEQQQLQAVVP